MSGVRVRFEPGGLVAEVAPGTTLHAAAAEAGVRLAAPCGGMGRCGSCRVRASGAVHPPDRSELEALGAAARAGARLACRARVDGPDEVVVEVPEQAGSIRTQMASVGPEPAVELPALRGVVTIPGVAALGAAVDLGTTTIAVRLHDLSDGRVLGEIADLNPQAAWGHDVLSRVSRALEGDARALRDVVTHAIEDLVLELTNAPRAASGTLREVVVVGNPAMIRLFAGEDVSMLGDGASPGVDRPTRVTSAWAADLHRLGDVRVVVGPEVSAFIGADTVAALLATALDTRDDDTLLIDLGTNGEVVLASAGKLYAASAAAGPAFEAYGLSSGMRAEPGAIEAVWLDDDILGVRTIGDESPRGLCGSGLVDLLAVLLATGALDATGRLQPEGPLAARVVETAAGRAFEVASDVLLTQQDIRQAQLAKAAVQAAIETVLDVAGRPPSGVAEVLIAGGFGSHLRPTSLAAVGVVPFEWTGRVTLAGNSALAGASAMLLSSDARNDADLLAARVRTVLLAGRPDFRERFVAALGFPEADDQGRG
ncbi:MAG TPA: ASKHA domain-containing protein [Cellulomonas sp.]